MWCVLLAFVYESSTIEYFTICVKNFELSPPCEIVWKLHSLCLSWAWSSSWRMSLLWWSLLRDNLFVFTKFRNRRAPSGGMKLQTIFQLTFNFSCLLLRSITEYLHFFKIFVELIFYLRLCVLTALAAIVLPTAVILALIKILDPPQTMAQTLIFPWAKIRIRVLCRNSPDRYWTNIWSHFPLCIERTAKRRK